jgi:uncharacterized protein (DUF1778 family)
MDVDLRIPVTREQKALIFEAAFLSQSDIAAWVRPLLLKAARKRVGESESQKKRAG